MLLPYSVWVFNPQPSCSTELTASCTLLMWTMCQANGCIWKVENYVDGTWKIIFVEQFGRFCLFSQSPPSFHQCDLQPGTHFWHSAHPSFFHEKLMWSCSPQNISLFILFPLFINFISVKAKPRGLEKERALRVPVFLTLQPATQTQTHTYTHTAPMVHAEPPTFSPHIVVILVKHVYGAPGGAWTTSRLSQMKHGTGSVVPSSLLSLWLH